MASATITGDLAGQVTEDGQLTTSGTVVVVDADAGENRVSDSTVRTEDSVYGTFTIDANGQWQYTLDNSQWVDSLNAGRVVTERFHLSSFDGSAPATEVVITITGANDAPVLHDPYKIFFNEGTVQTHDLLFYAVDPDAGETDTLTIADVTFAIDGGPATATLPDGFSVEGATLTADFSGESYRSLAGGEKRSIVLSYAVTDVHGGSSIQTFTIDLFGENEVPTTTDDSVSVTEDVRQTLTLQDFGSYADSNGDDFAAVVIMELPANGTLRLNGTAVTGGQYIEVADILANKLVYTPAANDDTDESLSFMVVDEQHGFSEPHTLTLDILPVDDPVVVTPQPGSDTLVGTAGDDLLTGTRGVRTMSGGLGDDTYVVTGRQSVIEASSEGMDTVRSSKSYTLSSNVENLILTGDSSSKGTGNDLNNELTGNSGKNVLVGAGGADKLTGGLGADRFTYLSVSDSSGEQIDTIIDFSIAEGDKVDVRKIDANVNRSGNQSFVFIGDAQFSDFANASGLMRFDAETHLLEGSVDADSDAEFQILLAGVTSVIGGLAL